MQRTTLVAFAVAVLCAACPSGALASDSGAAAIVSTDGLVYRGRVLTMTEDAVVLETTEGQQLKVGRERVALINLAPDWLSVRAYGTKDHTYYDLGGGYALPLPPDELGWSVSTDSEGHLFLHKDDTTLGIYAYLGKYRGLEGFLKAHAQFREAQEMPKESYAHGTALTVGGCAAQSFSYETTLKGAERRVLDVKVVGPMGQGCVISIFGSGMSGERFSEVTQEALWVVDAIRFFRLGT